MPGWWTWSTAAKSRALNASSPFFMSASRCVVRLVSRAVVVMTALLLLCCRPVADGRRGLPPQPCADMLSQRGWRQPRADHAHARPTRGPPGDQPGCPCGSPPGTDDKICPERLRSLALPLVAGAALAPNRYLSMARSTAFAIAW